MPWLWVFRACRGSGFRVWGLGHLVVSDLAFRFFRVLGLGLSSFKGSIGFFRIS